jgi:hypothetical protein
MKYTDQYMRRAYSRIQTELYPDTVFFLGDLFDGGREWSTRTTKSPEKQYQQYGDDYWMNEYRRFGSIFFDHWGDGGLTPRPGQPGRKFISSLPGNHDLGFAKGVQVGVRDRFHAYFGDGNRIDVLGNHTFVSIDSVSLSAFGVPSSQELEELWRPTVDFLDGAKEQKKKLTQRELRVQQGLKPYPTFPHHEIEAKDLPKATLPHADSDVTEFPTILLTHVPLYRAPDTSCGLQREHGSAISVSGGYQYQNVMNKEITTDIANKIGDIRYAFSGDDHDYCELVHRGYASGGGGIREITVKSISWAMGVRHPGIVLASLWNPVDAQGKPQNDVAKTIQTHLCLLPDQLAIFFRYALLFALTLFLLGTRAALLAYNILPSAPLTPEDPILPTTTTTHDKTPLAHPRFDTASDFSSHSTNSSTSSTKTTAGATPSLQVRNTAQTRGNTYSLPMPMPHQDKATNPYSYPWVQHAGFSDYGDGDDEEGKKGVRTWGKVGGRRKRKKGFALFREEFGGQLGRVLVFGLGWYFWLVWRG